MSNYAIIRFDKVKSAAAVDGRLRHHRRDVNVPFVDTSQPNMELRNMPAHQIGYKEFLRSQGICRTRRNAVQAVEFLLAFSPGALSKDQLQSWANSNLQFVSNLVGGRQNIYYAVVHLDESNPHMHIIAAPIIDHKLRWSRIIDGPSDCRKLQSDYADVMQQYGLSRGLDKRISKAVHVDARRYKAELIRDREALDNEKVEINQKKSELEAMESALQAAEGDMLRGAVLLDPDISLHDASPKYKRKLDEIEREREL